MPDKLVANSRGQLIAIEGGIFARAGMIRSDDGGLTWSRINGGLGISKRPIALAINNEDVLFVVRPQRGIEPTNLVFTSANDGDLWTLLPL